MRNYNAIVRAGFWILSPKDEWIQVQRAQHNKFVESGLKG